MPRKIAKPTQITLEMIEEHLRTQDCETEKHLWFALIVFAASIIVAGIIAMLPIGDSGIFFYGIGLFIIYLILYFRAYRKSKTSNH
jgi:hypothetical protein